MVVIVNNLTNLPTSTLFDALAMKRWVDVKLNELQR